MRTKTYAQIMLNKVPQDMMDRYDLFVDSGPQRNEIMMTRPAFVNIRIDAESELHITEETMSIRNGSIIVIFWIKRTYMHITILEPELITSS